MAKENRGGRPQGARGGQRGGGTLPGRRGKKRSGGGPRQREELPTASPGAAQAPAGGSVFGGAASVPVRSVGRPRARAERRGGPRAAEERLPRRRLAPLDFSYVRRDLARIGGTSAVSLALVLVLWAVLRG